MRFQYGFKKVLILNQISAVTLKSNPDTKEAKAPTIYTMTDETVDLNK